MNSAGKVTQGEHFCPPFHLHVCTRALTLQHRTVLGFICLLFQLTQLVERIKSFPVTSPVIKFLTGLELLLEKAQVCPHYLGVSVWCD